MCKCRDGLGPWHHLIVTRVPRSGDATGSKLAPVCCFRANLCPPICFYSIASSGGVCDRYSSQSFNSIVSPAGPAGSGGAVLPPRLPALLHFLWATAHRITYLRADCQRPPLTFVTIVSPPAAVLPSAADGVPVPLVPVSTTPPPPPPAAIALPRAPR